MSRVCNGCSTPRYDYSRPDDGRTWWTFFDYRGPTPATTLGLALTGYYCPACSSKIYDEPGGFERAVIVAKVTARLST